MDIPVIGNGDILTHYDASRFLAQSGATAVMAGRGPLIKPWLFKEFNDQAHWDLDAYTRVGVYARLVELMSTGGYKTTLRPAWLDLLPQ